MTELGHYLFLQFRHFGDKYVLFCLYLFVGHYLK